MYSNGVCLEEGVSGGVGSLGGAMIAASYRLWMWKSECGNDIQTNVNLTNGKCAVVVNDVENDRLCLVF